VFNKIRNDHVGHHLFGVDRRVGTPAGAIQTLKLSHPNTKFFSKVRNGKLFRHLSIVLHAVTSHPPYRITGISANGLRRGNALAQIRVETAPSKW